MSFLPAFAATPERSRGRLHPEPDRARAGPRDIFQRDRDRIVHCVAFRRLRHKTQVFVAPDGDHYPGPPDPQPRSRADRPDHGPGARPQRGSDRGAVPRPRPRPSAVRPRRRGRARRPRSPMPAGSTTTPTPSASSPGWKIPIPTSTASTSAGKRSRASPSIMGPSPRRPGRWPRRMPVGSRTRLLAEPRSAGRAIADDIAYDNHDIDDGLRAGLLDIDELLELPLAGRLWDAIDERHPGISTEKRQRALVRDMIGTMVGDVLRKPSGECAKRRRNDRRRPRRRPSARRLLARACGRRARAQTLPLCAPLRPAGAAAGARRGASG